MGIFGSKTRYHYRVSHTNLIEPENHQDHIKNAILRGTLGNQGIPESLVSEAINGISRKVERTYKRAKDSDLVGLPKGSIGGGDIDMVAVKAAVDQREGQSCTLIEAAFTTVAPEMLALHYLDEEFDIDLNNFKLQTTPPGLDRNNVYYYKSASWTFNHVTDAYLVSVIIEEHDESVGEIVNTHTLQYEDDSINPDAFYLYAAYTIDSDPTNNARIWVYNSELELYPSVNFKNLFDETPYFPIIPIRKNSQNIDELLNEEDYKEVKNIIKPIGFDMDMLIDQIVNGEDSDPDKMEEVFLMFGMDLRENDKRGREYLRRYFERLALESRTDRTSFEAWLNSDRTTPIPLNLIEVQDDEFNNIYTYNYIEVEEVSGSVGIDVGDIFITCTKGDTIHKESSAGNFIEQIMTAASGGTPFDLFSHGDELVINKQLTVDRYQKITIQGLTMYHKLIGDGVEGIVDKRVWDAYDPNAEDGTDTFYIPLSKPVVDSFNPIERSYIYQQSLSVVVYAIIKQKVKWYQRGWISWLITIIIIVIAFWTGQWWLLSAWQIALQVVIQIIIQFAVKAVLRELIDILGLDKFAILAVIVYIVALAYGVDLTEVLADGWVEMANLAMQVYQMVYMSDLEWEMKQWEDFTKDAKELQEEIEDAEALLNGDTIDLYTILKNQIYFNPHENPDDFYIRTIHDTNPGIKAIDSIHGYYDIMLQLPKFDGFTPKGANS